MASFFPSLRTEGAQLEDIQAPFADASVASGNALCR